MKLTLPQPVQKVLNTLHGAGYEAYCVGGCVRDLLLSGRPTDYDVTTSALPHQVRELFAKTADTGAAFGTVTVLTSGEERLAEQKTADGEAPTEKVEVTTYRTDGPYRNHRKPSAVSFGGRLIDDLRRRDFTINAICYNDEEGVVDPLEGWTDLRLGLIRAVGEPEDRFCEDALRILRCFRFAAKTGFAIEPKTLAAALRQARLLEQLSGERVCEELRRILALPNGFAALLPLLRSGGLAFCSFRPPDESDAEKVLLQWRSIKAEQLSEPAKFALLLQATNGDTDQLFTVLRAPHALRDGTKARLDTAEVLETAAGCRGAGESLCSDADGDYRLLRLLSRHGPEAVREGIALARIPSPIRQMLDERLTALLDSGRAYTVGMLALGGNELLACGAAGPQIGRILSRLLDQVMRGMLDNTQEVLLKAAQGMIGN